MRKNMQKWIAPVLLLVGTAYVTAAGLQSASVDSLKALSENQCTTEKVGTAIPVSSIGEPVSGVALNPPRWVPASGATPAYCAVDGSMAPVDRGPSAKPILFRVALPASWSRRAAQLGGGGTNGVIPNLTGEPLQRGFATYGSDSGHQNPPPGPRGAPPNPAAADWWSNDEAVRNFGYMQMKKTHDAAMVIVERMYGERPRFNYYIGNSQGGREALTVAQRYPADYDGILATVPVVSLSSLQVAPVHIRIQERPEANWITPAKVNAIRGEFMRQCDKLDGLIDGVINNYMGCRSIFDVAQGAPNRQPWAAKRCPNNIDPNPADRSSSACLTDGQISTLQLTYGRYLFESALANGVMSFGMWLPNTDPAGNGLISTGRLRGQEGAASDAPLFAHISVAGLTAGLMRDIHANPLDLVETDAAIMRRRRELSEILDSANPDLTAFNRRQGKMIVINGTNDTLASPGAQLDYYQSVIDKMGQSAVDQFARFFVIPQTGHGLSGTNYSVDGDGKTIPSAAIPNGFNRLSTLMDWVEKKVVPGKSLIVTAGEKSLPLCSYPAYPKYVSGPTGSASSYVCAAP
jgi:pimeloyl-ACP methyl ester carboxylesterase